jgi:hypothetical protein
MTVFHFQAVLESHDQDGWYVYRYYPDHVMAKSVSGLFRINPNTFVAEIVETAGAEEKGLASTDEQCVKATAEKVRRFQESNGVMPEEVFWVA